MRLLLLCVFLAPSSLASFCGENGVPFSLEVLPNGKPADPQGNFDGYFRDEERTSHLQANKFKANCSGQFDAVTCPKKNQWVGGINAVNHPRQPLILQCCSFEGLRFSQDVGVTTIAPGEAVTGGEVIRDGRQISFDVIANVKKVLDPVDHDKVLYEVTVRRMNCLPDPGELQTPFDEDIGDEMVRVLGNDDNRAPLDRPEDAPAPVEEAPELIQEIPVEPPREDQQEDEQPVQPELRQEVVAPIQEERKEKEANPNKNFFVHKKERQNQPTFGAPTYDPSQQQETAQRVHPRFVEQRPASEYSTTQTPPPITTTTTTLPPPTTTADVEPIVTTEEPVVLDYDPETVPAPSPLQIAEKKTIKLSITTPAPAPNPFLFPGFQPLPGFPPLIPPPAPLQPPAPAAAFAAPPFLPLAPLAPPQHHHHHHHELPQPAAAAAAPNPFALPNPFAFPQLPQLAPPAPLPNPFAPLPHAAGAASFNGMFGAAPPAPKVPGLEEQPTVVKPVIRTSSMHKHGGSPPGGAAPPAPAAAQAAPTLAPLLMPPPFPTLFGPFPFGGQQ
ncbi:hypothetical protein PFISCL1PPCAC_25495, partial [Pristionchus fissidentatus]